MYVSSLLFLSLPIIIGVSVANVTLSILRFLWRRLDPANVNEVELRIQNVEKAKGLLRKTQKSEVIPDWQTRSLEIEKYRGIRWPDRCQSMADKTKVMLELLEGDQTLNQIGSKYEVTPKSLGAWKATYLANARLGLNVVMSRLLVCLVLDVVISHLVVLSRV